MIKNRTKNKKGRLRTGSLNFNILFYIICAVYTLVILIPLYYIMISSFKDNSSIFGSPLGLPPAFDLSNYIRALTNARLIRAMGISTSITIGAEILTILLAFPAAYAIARIRTRMASFVETFFSVGFLIPVFATLVPIFIIFAKIGLINNPLALILFYPATAMPISIIILASFMRQVPREFEESAELDGANQLQIIYHIFFPISKPAVITVLVLNFLQFWNEFLFALILLSGKNRTIQVALTQLKSERLVDYGLVASGVVISVIPVYIMFIFFQEQITKGLTAGAVKG